MSKTIQVTPVILCGGSGTRLWPLSRAGFPKQFLVLSGSTSLFQQAVERVNGLSASDIALGDTLVVTNEEHRFLALDQLREMNDVATTLLLEPVSRNTAPALTIAALQAMEDGCDPVLVVTPADQTVIDTSAFTEALRKSIRVADTGAIVILGIAPTKPETGYGYIRRKGAIGNFSEYNVAQFIEKPDIENAQCYFASNDYSWNSGIFVLKASVWLKALKQLRPDIARGCEIAWANKSADLPFVRPHKESFTAIPSESIDYAVMEKCHEFLRICVVLLDAGWCDLGAWEAVWQVGPKDQDKNVTSGDVLLLDSQNCLVYSSGRFVSGVGLHNIVIIETPDALLVVNKAMSQEVKSIVAQLGSRGDELKDLHRKVFRPWGWYDTIDQGENFRVKRIQVNPGASLSLQKHQHRAEHWIVVKGIAEITNGNQVLTLKENQSTYIPQGQVHRLLNPGDGYLEIIEVQSGGYLGEDDIVRFEDKYKRV